MTSTIQPLLHLFSNSVLHVHSRWQCNRQSGFEPQTCRSRDLIFIFGLKSGQKFTTSVFRNLGRKDFWKKGGGISLENTLSGYAFVTTEIVSILPSACEFQSCREYGCATSVCTKEERRFVIQFYGRKCTIHTFICSLWRQCCFLGKCIRIVRNIQERRDICDWCWTLEMPIYETGDEKLNEASDMVLGDRI